MAVAVPATTDYERDVLRAIQGSLCGGSFHVVDAADVVRAGAGGSVDQAGDALRRLHLMGYVVRIRARAGTGAPPYRWGLTPAGVRASSTGR